MGSAAVFGGALLALGLLNWGLRTAPRPAHPPITEMRFFKDEAALASSMLGLGMRRLSADLALIRLILYYGTKKHFYENPEEHHDHPGHEGHDHGLYEGGHYGDMLARTQSIMDLDPFWRYPVLFSAGALAFNLNRPHEAVSLLQQGLKRLPGDPEYAATLAAISFQKKDDMRSVVQSLMPLMEKPDTSTMLRNMVAFMNERLGNREAAARLYLDIIKSGDPSYQESARRGLQRLGIQL